MNAFAMNAGWRSNQRCFRTVRQGVCLFVFLSALRLDPSTRSNILATDLGSCRHGIRRQEVVQSWDSSEGNINMSFSAENALQMSWMRVHTHNIWIHIVHAASGRDPRENEANHCQQNAICVSKLFPRIEKYESKSYLHTCFFFVTLFDYTVLYCPTPCCPHTYTYLNCTIMYEHTWSKWKFNFE